MMDRFHARRIKEGMISPDNFIQVAVLELQNRITMHSVVSVPEWPISNKPSIRQTVSIELLPSFRTQGKGDPVKASSPSFIQRKIDMGGHYTVLSLVEGVSWVHRTSVKDFAKGRPLLCFSLLFSLQLAQTQGLVRTPVVVFVKWLRWWRQWWGPLQHKPKVRGERRHSSCRLKTSGMQNWTKKAKKLESQKAKFFGFLGFSPEADRSQCSVPAHLKARLVCCSSQQRSRSEAWLGMCQSASTKPQHEQTLGTRTKAANDLLGRG